MDVQHDVGTGAHQILIAAFQSVSAEVRGCEGGALQHGAHRAIEDDDARIQCLN